MLRYQVYVNQEALTGKLGSGHQRRSILDFIHSLASNPYCAGDFSQLDETGRTVKVKIIGRFAVTFWADHAVLEVKVTHILPADK